MPINLPRFIAAAALISATCVGCGPATGTPPSLLPVKGKVTYKGQPLTQGIVRFEPDGYGRGADGKLQPDGTFVLSTLKEGDGVVAGHHRVYIAQVDKRLARDRAISKYRHPTTSDWTADVSPENTEFTFEIR
jgi:hypothetical protein